MSREKLLKFLKESKILLSHATPEQKVKIIRLLKENVRHFAQQKPVQSKTNLDYLDEK